MKRLWIAVVTLVALGSLYPFDFRAAEIDADALRRFILTCCTLSSRGDIIGNFILFLPVGFAGMLALWPQANARHRLVRVLAVATLFALVLQLIQFYLPSRDQSLQDVAWNFFGALAGAALVPLASPYSRRYSGVSSGAALVPAMLIGAWLAYRLLPFVPALDLQLWKDSLKPLLSLDLQLATVIRDVSAWALTGYLLRHTRGNERLDKYLPYLATAVLGAEVMIVDNVVSTSNAAGMLLGITLWIGYLRHQSKPELWLLMALALAVFISGLTPIAFRTLPAEFGWLPFQGFLGGSMYVNSHSALQKLFLYGSFIYLCRRRGTSFVFATFIGASAVMVIEIAQTRLIGHTPEITDPVLVILAALAIQALERHSANAVTARTADTLSFARPATERHERVRLHAGQFEFLQRLAAEANLSPGETASRIIDNVLDDAQASTASESAIEIGRWLVAELPECDSHDAVSARGRRWITLEIPLPPTRFALLSDVSVALGISRSRLARRFIAGFIASLDSAS